MRTLNSTWLSKVIGDQIRLSPFMKLIDLKELIKRAVGCEVTLKMCWLTKRRALETVRESLVVYYAQLGRYVEELARSNPMSTIILKSTGEDWAGPPEFRRFYICFHAVRQGFLSGCRKFIGVDGCFLKTWIKGELLVAMGKDANNQMYPIAWDVVEKEDQHTWAWFLNLLDRDILIGDGSGWTIMSDQQKGLELAVKNLFPEIWHRNCARHIYANFRKKGYTGVNFRQYFWASAKSTTIEYFEKNMNKIRKISEDAYIHLMDRDPKRWSKAFFPCDVTCDAVDNNLCESFNNWILEARYKSIINMLEDIRRQVMVRLKEKRKYMRKRLSEGRRFGHRITKALNESIAMSRECVAMWNGDDKFEITGLRGGTTVNLNEMTCTCRAWQLCGIPCCHAVAAITEMRKDPQDFVYKCFSGDSYLKCYSTMMNPINGVDLWPESDRPVLLPPPARVLKGRPQYERRRDAVEDGKGGKGKGKSVPEEEDPLKAVKASRIGMKMTCRICKEKGHNVRGCPKKPADYKPDQNRKRKREAAAAAKSDAHKSKTSKKDATSDVHGRGQTSRANESGVQTRTTTRNPIPLVQPSFTRRGQSFITSENLQQQSKGKSKKVSKK